MTIQRQVLFGKLNATLFKSLESATALAKIRGNPYIEMGHWLNQLCMIENTDFHVICRYFSIDLNRVEKELADSMSTYTTGAASIIDFSHYIETAIERAWTYATLQFNENHIRSAALLTVLLENTELRRMMLGLIPSMKNINIETLSGEVERIIQTSIEQSDHAYDQSDLSAAIPGEASGAIGSTPNHSSQKALDLYCTDLTERARLNKIDPVIGRDYEIKTMIDILLRRKQNNPLLTGEAGVGKTAVVEGLAIAIVQANVPPSLKNIKLLSLDVGALIAGASMKGEFESRLKSLIKEVQKSLQPIVLFIDEIHTLVGAGGQSGTGDAANLLKPALARGELRTIGATTWSEYKKYIEKDPALTRRFQVLQVMEPSEPTAIDMIRSIVPAFSAHHQVLVLDSAVQAAVKLSSRYIPSRQLPDKAISLLDTACARVAMSQHSTPDRIAYLKQTMAAQQAHMNMLIKEQQLGIPAEQSIIALEQHLDVHLKELGVLEEQWQQEKQLVEQIHALRTQISDTKLQSEHAAQRHKLAEQEAALKAIQKDHPLIQLEVNDEVVASIVADWTGIPVGKMLTSDIQDVIDLAQQLSTRVIGQDFALHTIAERIKTAKAQLTDPNKPIGVFMLVGPSGVGKTETALALAEALYGGEQNLITLNMNEFQESHTVSTLKGSPPGYVGYGEGGILTEAVRRKPYSVILLDEMEKAHSDVVELFYQVFDKGWMEDAEGRYIDFKNTVILVTSNVGSELLHTLFEDELQPEAKDLVPVMQQELLKVFPSAFVGRVTTVPYVPITEGLMDKLVRAQLQKVVQRMATVHHVTLSFSEDAIDFIMQQCDVKETGARQIINYIEQRILPELSSCWLDAQLHAQILHEINVELTSIANTATDATSGEVMPKLIYTAQVISG